ncbi:DUF2834 domain-containing protein [Nostoc sp. FACHB-110]|uniref:DUF2834 domain-containing protein n=1 Tax=Nostoc sp. FACHB-110 TaxID=2692834 RepID=UPI001689C2C2|nr:DUF2834 domain-containing protein [Nostoc sp. FACHB-110]MBD2438020.1 DUF2834 domain-containing protein [Nostoc sp. FACHB-110]
MLRKIALVSLWVGFFVYAFFLAPPEQPGTFELIKKLSLVQWEGINPVIISLFNIMGVWPLIYSTLVFADGRCQKIPAWLFATASFGVGAFALLPYLFLRKPNTEFVGQKNVFIKLLDSRVTGIILTVIASIIVSYGVQAGNWQDFIQQWQTNRFIHVMSLDFCLLSVLFPVLLGDDMARRGWKNNQIFWLISLLPLFGPLIYLCVRPALPEAETTGISKQQVTAN